MSRNTIPRARQEQTVGLLANGAAGSWNIDVDETSNGPQRRYLQLDGPWYLYVELPKLAIVPQILEFLERHISSSQPEKLRPKSAAPAPVELEVSDLGGITLAVLWDVEHGDRCTFLVQGRRKFCTRLSIAGDDLRDFVQALKQVARALEDDGSLAKAC